MKNLKLILVLFLITYFETYSQQNFGEIYRNTAFRSGIGLGSVIAVVISWERNKSVLFAFLHGIFSWFYVIYFLLTRKPEERK